MAHELRTTHDQGFTGTLTLGFAPDGELSFEDGVATVSGRTVAEDIASRYANITLAGDVNVADAADATETARTSDEAAFDPAERTLDELEDELAERDLDNAQLQRIRDAEASSDDRAGAHDLIDDALAE